MLDNIKTNYEIVRCPEHVRRLKLVDVGVEAKAVRVATLLQVLDEQALATTVIEDPILLLESRLHETSKNDSIPGSQEIVELLVSYRVGFVIDS